MSLDDNEVALNYARILFNNILDWYKNAEFKAQVLLGLAGAFLSFLTGSVFIKKTELYQLTSLFGPETWVFLFLSVLSLLSAIVCSLNCLRSRLADPDDLVENIKVVNEDDEGKVRSMPETLFFFGMIARFQNRKMFQKRLAQFTLEDEVQALTFQIFHVSTNVLRKHMWVNRGFVWIVLAISFFLAAGVTYLLRVQF